MNINESAISPDTTATAAPDRPVFTPAADIYETPNAVLIRCDLPGVTEENLEITLSNRILTLSGKQSHLDRGACETSSFEYRTGVYRRSFGIHRDLDEAAVKARLKNGVLEIELPKVRDTGLRKIPIEN